MSDSTIVEASRYHVQGFEAVVCSEAMHKLMQMVERVARSNAAVLIVGETGSGKEFIARSIHHHSLRCSKPWVDLNCAALPENLVESELFGYEKGAFSGADTPKPGLFELADQGTLFLDEIGELEPKVQVKLLRVLDAVPYYRLGGSRKISVDVRIVAATNQDLEEKVRQGRFRSDLYHRLGQFQLKVPPLRNRPEDIIGLAQHLLNKSKPEMHFSEDALRALLAYSWPGNVRELRNVVLQAGTLAEDAEIRAADLPPEIGGAPRLDDEVPSSDLAEIERQTIVKVLAGTGGHQGQAAEQLGISRRTLSRKLKQYRIDAERRSSNPLGMLGEEQQTYYRAALDVPVTICTRGQELNVRSVNLATGGLAVSGITNPLKCSGDLEIRFTMPDGLAVEATGRIVWADVRGKAGIRFTHIDSQLARKIHHWISERQQEEGWAVSESRSAD
ncbi:MAG TPA: sigma 54-interacting transcriptional regulator [Terriglobales bacterium]|nr:sigma 54-interacting transcriptional regulator [Terriglobales bacterium]